MPAHAHGAPLARHRTGSPAAARLGATAHGLPEGSTLAAPGGAPAELASRGKCTWRRARPWLLTGDHVAAALDAARSVHDWQRGHTWSLSDSHGERHVQPTLAAGQCASPSLAAGGSVRRHHRPVS